MDYIELLSKWVYQTRESASVNQSFQNIISELGIGDVLWLKKGKDLLFIYCYSENNPHQSLTSFDGLALSSTDIGSLIEISGSDYHLSLKFGQDDFLLTKGETQAGLENVFCIILSILERDAKKAYLDNSLKVFQSSLSQVGENYQVHTNEMPESFIRAVAPVITYTIVHEDWGPAFVATWPPEFNNIQNVLYVVNIYSTLDGAQIARLGQVSTSLPTSSPEDGEINSLVFTIQNEEARGNHEVHAISVVLSQNFVNMSKILVFQIKGLLFSMVEQIRQIVGERQWKLFIGKDHIESPEVKHTFENLLRGLHIQIANLFAMQIGESEVRKWR